MKLPDNTDLYETPISIHWFDENGIMCATSKKVERTIEHYEEVMKLYKRFIDGGDKLCLLADASDTMPMSKEVREYVTAEMPKYIKAHAVISKEPLLSSLSNTFMNLSWAGFPVKLFSNVDEAKQWLKEYL